MSQSLLKLSLLENPKTPLEMLPQYRAAEMDKMDVFVLILCQRGPNLETHLKNKGSPTPGALIGISIWRL
ncbi:MAG: hypothetical protein WHS82_02870 [Candidatus Methanosuratincola sp.]